MAKKARKTKKKVTTKAAKTKAQKAKAKSAHPNAITDREMNTARRMAGRKNGVTRRALAEKLDIPIDRASQILKRIGARGKVPEKPIPGANRTKVFTVAA